LSGSGGRNLLIVLTRLLCVEGRLKRPCAEWRKGNNLGAMAISIQGGHDGCGGMWSEWMHCEVESSQLDDK
jgi:hypothetical protein